MFFIFLCHEIYKGYIRYLKHIYMMYDVYVSTPHTILCTHTQLVIVIILLSVCFLYIVLCKYFLIQSLQNFCELGTIIYFTSQEAEAERRKLTTSNCFQKWDLNPVNRSINHDIRFLIIVLQGFTEPPHQDSGPEGNLNFQKGLSKSFCQIVPPSHLPEASQILPFHREPHPKVCPRPLSPLYLLPVISTLWPSSVSQAAILIFISGLLRQGQLEVSPAASSTWYAFPQWTGKMVTISSLTHAQEEIPTFSLSFSQPSEQGLGEE